MKPVFVGMPEAKKTKKPEAEQQQPAPKIAKPKQKSLFIRITEIVTDDFNYYFRGTKSKSRQEWEDYQRFCELARKNMK